MTELMRLEQKILLLSKLNNVNRQETSKNEVEKLFYRSSSLRSSVERNLPHRITYQISRNCSEKFQMSSFSGFVNQPRFCFNASWNSNAATFANSGTVGQYPRGIFIDKNNTIYLADDQNNRILIWSDGSTSPTRYMPGSLSNPYAIFVTSDVNIYVNYNDNVSSTRRVDQWTLRTNIITNVTITPLACFGIFIDISSTLYCSMASADQVVKKWLSNNSTTFTIIAGTHSSGGGSNQLYEPHGIFVDTNFDLYVADSKNNRIQLFRPGETNGRTVAGSGSSSSTYTLDYPTAVILDADKYLFIFDSGTTRIIGTDRTAFRCLAGCSPSPSSGFDRFKYPWYSSFDSHGNIFVVDSENNRVQKFLLSTNSCGLYLTSIHESAMYSHLTFIVDKSCFQK